MHRLKVNLHITEIGQHETKVARNDKATQGALRRLKLQLLKRAAANGAQNKVAAPHSLQLRHYVLKPLGKLLR